MSHLADSNCGPTLYESVALPTELRWHVFVSGIRESNPRPNLAAQISFGRASPPFLARRAKLKGAGEGCL